jgi:hypothetical protein
MDLVGLADRTDVGSTFVIQTTHQNIWSLVTQALSLHPWQLWYRTHGADSEQSWSATERVERVLRHMKPKPRDVFILWVIQTNWRYITYEAEKVASLNKKKKWKCVFHYKFSNCVLYTSSYWTGLPSLLSNRYRAILPWEWSWPLTSV